MQASSPSKLVHLLIGKSVLEALLITGVSVAFYFATTNPFIRGWLDQGDNHTVSGWVVDESNPAARVEVQLFIDGKFVADQLAAESRPDVRAANRASDDWHGFIFTTPPLQNGEHEACVYAVHASGGGARRTLQLIGKPRRFQINGSIAEK
jgi:hypothetical protein